MKKQTNNPTGKNGKPVTLLPMTFEEAVKKMLGTPPPPKDEPKKTTKPTPKKKR